MAVYTMDEYAEQKKKEKKKREPRIYTMGEYAAKMNIKNPIANSDDIAPVKTNTNENKKSNGYFKKSEGGVGEAAAGSATDLLHKLTSGFVGGPEGIVQGLAQISPYVTNIQKINNGQMLTSKDWEQTERQKKVMQEYAKKDYYNEEDIAKKILSGVSASSHLNNVAQAGGMANEEDWKRSRELSESMKKYIEEDMEGHSVFDNEMDSVFKSGGEMLFRQAANPIAPWQVTALLSSLGSQAGNALNEGAAYDEATLSGLVSGGGEIVSEYLGGGFSFGSKTLDDILLDPFLKNISNKGIRTGGKITTEIALEGLEEVISEAISNAGTKAYKEEDMKKLLLSDEAVEGYKKAFISGGLLGGFGSGAKAVKSAIDGVDYTTGLNRNEETVVEKVIENRIKEKEADGRKLDKKEKKAIREQVMKDLEKGYIDIDTIESVLGGETYNKLKSETENETRLQKEFNDLNKMKLGEMTGEQTDRKAELKKQLEELKSNSKIGEIRSQLDSEMSKAVEGTKLAESYKEKTRRRKTYEADLTKYDEKQQAVIRKAVESGILNNTNRTHEFVDMIAKISADKGVSFDFINNTKLKESGFAVEGKIVNGYIKDGNIAINIDSNKALNTVVGHEITHVLEGTELYTELQKTVKEYAAAKGEYQTRYDALTELYKDVEGAEIENEITADLVGEYLFTDSDFINSLSTEKPNIFRKIYEEIKYLYKLATAGSKEARELEKVKRIFDKAYQESTAVKENTKYSFAGKNAVTSDKSQLTKARDMAIDGYSSEEIRQATGWHQGYDGKWRYEIDDSQMEIIDTERNYAKLNEIIKHDKLFEAYPILKEVNVVFQNLDGNMRGSFNRQFFTIDLSRKLKADAEELKNTLIHEIQHVIQYEEGFASGSNTEYWEKRLEGLFDSRPIEVKEQEKALREKYLELLESNREFVLDMENLEKMTPTVARGAVDWNTLEQIEDDPIEWQEFDAERDRLAEKYGEDEVFDFMDMQNEIKELKTKGKRTGTELYYDTAGEIEARETAKRRTYSEVERKRYQPQNKLENTKRDNVVFAKYSLSEEVENVSDRLSMEEWKQVQSAVADHVKRNYHYEKSADGDIIIPVNNKLVYTDANYDSPGINKIIEFDSKYENEVDAARRLIYEAEKSESEVSDAYEVIEDIIGHEVIHEYMQKNSSNAKGYDRRTGRGKSKSDSYHSGFMQERIRRANEIINSVNNNTETSSKDGVFFDENTEKSSASENIRYSLSKDSTGKKLSDKQKEYFKDSKVVDKDGNLKVMYHGTKADFNVFDPAKGTKKRLNMLGEGNYFTIEESKAQKYGERVVPVYLNLKKPYRVNNRTFADRMAILEQIEEDFGIVLEKRSEVKDFLESNGYDGILYYDSKNAYDDEFSIAVAYDSEQIKNTDNMNPTTVPDIRHSLGNHEIEPTGSHNVYGEDIALETSERITEDSADIAPTKDYLPSEPDIAPVKEEVPLYEENNGQISVFEDENFITKKAQLTEKYEQKRAELQEKISDKNAYMRRMASDLYNELSNLRKGVKTSSQLGYLLDHGYSWNEYKRAFLNVKNNPAERVDWDSVPESLVREVIDTEYENDVYSLDNLYNDYKNQIAELEGKTRRTSEETKRKATTRTELHENIIDNVKSVFSAKGFDFDNVLRKAKNLSTLSTVDNIPQRVMEKALGYKQGQVLSDLTVNKVAQNETEGTKWLNSFTDKKKGILAQISKKYHIKPGSKESAAAQMYAEGFYVNNKNEIIKYGDEELAKDFPNPKVREDIKGLAKDERIRQIYDDTLARINESRTRNAYPEIPRLENYFLHFRVMDDTFSRLGLPFNPNDIRAKDLPTDLNGVTADLKPGQPYFASQMHRTGKRTSFDLLGGLERYLTSAKNQIFHIDDIQTFRALRNYIADTYGQANGLGNLDKLSEEEAQQRIEQVYSSHLSTFAKFLNEEANILAGKTALIDRGLEGIIGRRGITFLNTVNKQVGSNMVGFNVSSSLTNVLPVVQTLAKTSKTAFVKAFTQTVSNKISSLYGRNDGFAEQSPVMIRRKGADRFYRTPFQKVGDAGYVIMSAIDDFTTEIIARTKYNELTRKGMKPQQAHYETDKWVSRLMGDRSLGQMPQLYNSKMLGLITKFQLEVRNQLDSQFYDTIQEAKVSSEHIENGLVRNAKTAAKVASTFTQLAVAQHLFGTVFESIAGYNPAFDIIEVLLKTLGYDDDEESEDTVLDNVEQGFLMLLEDLPYTSTLTGGRIPISSALPIEEFVTGKDEYGNEKSRLETLGEIAPYYILPTGYGQIKKSVQGLKMFDDNLPVKGSYTDSGNLRFPIEDTPGNRLKAGLFGQYASSNAREYFDRELAPLKEKQIQEYKELDIPIRDYWDYREGLKGLETLSDKADYINSLELPVAKKNVLVNNQTDREIPIDLTGFNNSYENFEEFDFAVRYPEKYKVLQEQGISVKEYNEKYKETAFIHTDDYSWGAEHPGKYTVSKVFSDDLKVYRQYTKELNAIKGDGAKEKKKTYINELNLDYGQKIILYRSLFDSKTDKEMYDADIVEYLNSRTDISYEDMVTILKELDFKVYQDGKVEW